MVPNVWIDHSTLVGISFVDYNSRNNNHFKPTPLILKDFLRHWSIYETYANVRISIKISLKFVPKGPINNIPA